MPQSLQMKSDLARHESTSIQSNKAGSRSKKMACVECRQQKSRCDAQELYPQPCSRCLKKGVECVVQPDYKRTYKRAKLQRIEEELESLKKNLTSSNTNNTTINPSSTPSDTSRSPSQYPEIRPAIKSIGASPLSGVPGPSIIRETTPVVGTKRDKTAQELHVEFTDNVLHCLPKQLGEVQLSTQQIKDLYLEFVNKYHRFLPIVDVSRGPERIHRLCPILFWVIVSIALRHLSTNTLMQLAPTLKTALAEITISPITRYLPNENDEPILNVSSVYSVQALLLYSFWPPLTSSLSADSSWNTVGIAIFQAIRLGLNGPGTNNYNMHQPDTTSALIKEHIKTWIACNIVSQTIATTFGFPSFVSFDSSVVDCTRPMATTGKRDIPTCMKHMVEISHFEDQVAKVLNSNNVDSMGLVDPVERLPLLKMLTQQIDELELKLKNEEMDDIRKFQIHAAKVHLLTYYFLDNSRVASFELRRGLVSLFNAALGLLSHADSVSKKDPNFIKYVPGVFVLRIWQAAFIVGKLCHSFLSNVIDIGAGKQFYAAAIQLAMKASVLKHDMAYRSSGIMRNMWQLYKALREKGNFDNLDVTIRSRMSSSVFFDCLWVLREQVGMIKLNPKTEAPTGQNEDYDEDEDVFDSDEGGKPTDPGTVGSEGSNTSSQRRKKRTLSNNYNVEDSARRIIRTIPLDPTPISLKDGRSDSNKAASLEDIINKSSPDSNSSTRSSNGRPNKKQLFQAATEARTPEAELRNQIHQKYHQQFPSSSLPHTSLLELSPTNIPSLDMTDDWTSDMLWKDVDSVMNDFGFNIDDLAKSNNNSSNGAFAIHPQEPQADPLSFNTNQSLFEQRK